MTVISFIEWNGNERVDPADIALPLASAEENEVEDEDDDLQ